MIDLEPHYLTQIQRILDEHVPGIETRAFGSRVRGSARTYSDLDLALVGYERIDRQRIEALKDAFAESDLPFMVDVLDWNALSENFRGTISTTGFEVVRRKGSGMGE
jgi:predicted nucleotidyltransferase